MEFHMYIADLHIHSRYSMATSRDLIPEYLDLWARKKGIHILGTGDFTHPAWRRELEEALEPAEPGLYRLKKERSIPLQGVSCKEAPRFVISGEISTIYKKNGRVRKVHSLILLPGLKAAHALSERLEAIGNIRSDGRPILGLDCHDLLALTLEVCPEAMYIPAHIWTPHFSLLGARSGFDSIEECFEELTPFVKALETGLSSDPAMNWRLPQLDSYQLISNSDAHSPGKLGREANLLDTERSYQGLYEAIQEGRGLAGTIEFFPQEGKYFYDGHRKCGVSLSPSGATSLKGICPVCGKGLTMGVLNRTLELSAPNRGDDFQLPGAHPFEHLIPLPEVIALSLGVTSSSGVKVSKVYEEMLQTLGNEFEILRNTGLDDIKKAGSPEIARLIRKLREGTFAWQPGFDGQYGRPVL